MSTTTEKGFLPTKTEAIEAAKSLGGLSLGMIAAHNISNFTKAQKPMVQNALNGVMVLGGAIGFVKAKNTLLKYVALGAAVFGAFKLIGTAAKSVTNTATTEGINGILPDSVKVSIRKFLPTFAGIDEVSGLNGVDDVQGYDKDMPTLNDAGDETMNSDETTYGVGSAMQMAA